MSGRAASDRLTSGKFQNVLLGPARERTWGCEGPELVGEQDLRGTTSSAEPCRCIPVGVCWIDPCYCAASALLTTDVPCDTARAPVGAFLKGYCFGTLGVCRSRSPLLKCVARGCAFTLEMHFERVWGLLTASFQNVQNFTVFHPLWLHFKAIREVLTCKNPTRRIAPRGPDSPKFVGEQGSRTRFEFRHVSDRVRLHSCSFPLSCLI